MKYLKKYERIISVKDDDYEELIDKLHELFIAIEACNLNKIKTILKSNKKLINLSDDNDMISKTPLLIALETKTTDPSAKLLIELGADVNIPDGEDHPPLLHAILNYNIDMINALIMAGADVNYIWKVKYNLTNKNHNIFHNSPLLKIIELYNSWLNNDTVLYNKYIDYCITILEILINAGADLEYKIRNLTPLLYVISNKDLKLAYLLIRGGANLNAKNKKNLDIFSDIKESNPFILEYIIDNTHHIYNII